MEWAEYIITMERDAEIKTLNLELDYMLLTLNDALLKNEDAEIKSTKDRLYEICNELNKLKEDDNYY